MTSAPSSAAQTVPHHRFRDGDRLALAARKRCDLRPHAADSRDTQRLEHVERLLLHLKLGERLDRERHKPSHGLASEIHVLDDIEVVAEREILVDGFDAEARCIVRRADLHLAAFEKYLSCVGRVRPGDALDERRLAGSVVAAQRDYLAGIDVEVDIGQRLHGTEVLRDPSQFE